MTASRAPAVAGLFYADEPSVLRRDIEALLECAAGPGLVRPRVLIVPHAGYIYSGIVAAQAYARLQPWRDTISRVVLLGPAHRVAVHGIGVSSAPAFDTPLGRVALDQQAVADLRCLPFVTVNDRAHAPEHSLEVQLPFLQAVLPHFQLVPLLVADGAVDHVRQVIEPWWEADDTLLVISTDLSHFLDYDAARAVDQCTDAAIMQFDYAAIGPEDACGCHPLNGLLYLARERAATIERLMLCNSGDTAGTRNRVVGYASYAVA